MPGRQCSNDCALLSSSLRCSHESARAQIHVHALCSPIANLPKRFLHGALSVVAMSWPFFSATMEICRRTHLTGKKETEPLSSKVLRSRFCRCRQKTRAIARKLSAIAMTLCRSTLGRRRAWTMCHVNIIGPGKGGLCKNKNTLNNILAGRQRCQRQ